VQIKDALHQQFPHMEINGGNYPTPASKVLMAKLVQVVQFGLIGVAVAGDYLMTHVFNFPENGPFPPLYETIREKKMFVGMGAWIVGNSITQGLTSSGAFEIYYNGQIVSSKLDPPSAAFASANNNYGVGSGGVPSLQYIIQQMHRIDPNLSLRRRVDDSKRSSKSQRPIPQSSANDDDDVNRDVRDLSYDDL